jgi:hypothetical protein
MCAQSHHVIKPSVPVTVDNFVRAETDMYMGVTVALGAFGRFAHRREPMSIDKQSVARPNRDALYSSAVFDLDAGPVTITLPDAGGRYMSLQVIDEDHYVCAFVYGAGRYMFSRESVGTRYAIMGVRTLVNPEDRQDLARAHVLQDAIGVNQRACGRFEVCNWDAASQTAIRDALVKLSQSVPDARHMFGARGQVDPVRHLIGTASAWGGNPEREAMVRSVTPHRNDGATAYRLRVKDVPVDAFWSISVYNAEGYFEPNKDHVYAINSTTAARGADGSITIQFGKCDDAIPNCLPITCGWNYTVRLYRPRPEVVSGEWVFPDAEPMR